MLDRENPVRIGWGTATRANSAGGYRIVSIGTTRQSARNETNRRNSLGERNRYRTISLSATHP